MAYSETARISRTYHGRKELTIVCVGTSVAAATLCTISNLPDRFTIKSVQHTLTGGSATSRTPVMYRAAGGALKDKVWEYAATANTAKIHTSETTHVYSPDGTLVFGAVVNSGSDNTDELVLVLVEGHDVA